MMRILITGAAGKIGSLVARNLKECYQIRGHDCVPIPDLEDTIISDLNDFDALLKATEGMDAVAHIGAQTGVKSSWEEVLNSNIIGTYNVFEACRLNGVRRVVFTSRAGVLSEYPPSITRTVDMLPTPVSHYSVSKVFGEAMAYSYARQYDMEFVCVRIGNFQLTRNKPTHPHHLSHRDCIHLFEQALTHPGVKFEIVFGVSASNWRLYDLEHGQQAIGYYPQDYAEVPKDQRNL